ncbi:MAG: hypothetical protein NTX24_05195 [Candidatus Pacearchaeota archaeon]|nr:hypothetical protein [Candidatus Pacearchaeota archaeon]
MKTIITLQNGKKLNKHQFIDYFERKVLYTIRKYDLLKSLKDLRDERVVLPKVEKLLTLSKIKNVFISQECMDDIAYSFLLIFMEKESDKSLNKKIKDLLPKYNYENKEIIRPFYLIKKEEMLIYARIKGIKLKDKGQKNKNKKTDQMIKKIDIWISDLEKKHLEIKNAIVNSLLRIEKLN